MRSGSFILLLILLFFQNVCHANELHFKNYNNKQGLSHNTVYCSLQDKRGFMWFGTAEGLNRFDGHSFKVYRHIPGDPTSLPNDRVLNLFEDSEERLWICTDEQTCFYNYKDDTFTPLKFTEDDKDNYYFFSVMEDLQKNLWFTNYDRIIKHSITDKKTTVFSEKKYFTPIDACVTEEGNSLFASRHNIHIYNSGNNDFISLPVITEKEKSSLIEITAICQAQLPYILIGTNKAGLKLFNQISHTTETIIPEIQVRSIYPANKDEYWIASESGLFIYNISNKSITNLRKSLTNEYSIADNAIYSLAKDKEGGMWVGSFFGGISYLPKEYTRFNLFIGGKTHSQMLGNAVREICPDQYGNLWLGTEDNGINKYNLTTGEITNYSSNNELHRLSASNIHGLWADNNKLWIGTYNKGIEVMDIPSGKIIKQYTRENTNNGLISDFILCFYKTSQGELLIGTSGGILTYNPDNDQFSLWNDAIRTLIRQIYEDKDGNIWVASMYGVYFYDIKNKKTTHYLYDEYDKNSIPNNDISSIFEDSKRQIWVTTTQGICLLNKSDNTFKTFTIKDGLPSNITYRILEDGEKKFWVSTANGLVQFDPETHAVRVFTHTDGLHETQFNYSSSYKSPLGTMYMGTINGLISFNPQQFKDDLFSPPIYITHIRLPKNNEKESNRISIKPIEETDMIKLPHNMSSFTLSYVALSFTSPEAIQYSYMLEGIDRDWVQMEHKRDVTFANLPPGQYIFKVKSTNSSGIWQNNEKKLIILITPPFWATRWAYLLYFIIVILLIWIFYSYKKFKFEEKNRISLAMFERTKEKELYDAKIQFFTFITHEIRTPLTLIKAPLEKIIRSNDGTSSTRENLKVIERNTQRLLNLSNQLLDFRKTESKGFKLNFVKTDINMFLEDTIRSFKTSFLMENKNFSIILPEIHLISSVDREALSKIVSNLLTNAIKYSDKSITLELAPSEKDKTFSISVCNDGILIPEEEKAKIFEPFYRLKETENIQGSGIGLSLAKTLAEFHNGTLFYSYTPDGLNQFSLVLPQEQEGSFESIGDENPAKTITSISVSPQLSNRATVLIVEDQKDMRQFIVNELQEFYNVMEAENGKEAISILANNNVNIIVSDVMMPIMDGFEFCNKTKNDINYSHIPFIILTAQHNLQSRLEGLNKGADAYIEKPFSTDLLLAQISNLLKSRELLAKSYLEKPLVPAISLSLSKMDDIFLEKLNNYLDEQLSNEQLNVEVLAETMGMSTSSLYRKVKAISGLSPVDFIKVTRLKKAVQIMQEGESRINEIAFQVGFSTPSYFSTCFLKQYGITPSDFMKDENNRQKR